MYYFGCDFSDFCVLTYHNKDEENSPKNHNQNNT